MVGNIGEKGRGINPSNQQQQISYFSYGRVVPEVPEPETAINFNRHILPDLLPQLRGSSLTNGMFTCVVGGIYFFSYHASIRNNVCLKLVKNGSISHITMCDTSEGYLVTSGSALLELQAGDTVSLQATSESNNFVTSQSSTSHTFTGFLVFPTA